MRILLVKLQQLVLKRRQFEEITLLGKPFRLAAAIRTLGGRRWIRLRRVRFAGHAIPTRVRAFVYMAVRFLAPVQLLHAFVVALFRRSHEFVVLDAEQFPQIAVLRVNAIRESLRVDALSPGGTLDLLPVLVGPAKQLYIKTHHAFISGNGVGHDRRISASQMRRRVHVVQRCGDVESIGHSNLVYRVAQPRLIWTSFQP